MSQEIEAGTWEVLRTTPMPTSEILLAKMFGGLARLRIWKLISALSIYQGGVTTLVMLMAGFGKIGVFVGFLETIRPFSEILFSALASMYISTYSRSPVMALIGSYATVILFRLVNNNTLWNIFILDGILQLSLSAKTRAITYVAPSIAYLIAIIFLWFGLIRRAYQIEINA